ncbi:hypothetical protein PMIN01_06356 [Paraphaeosphaeria minitans]|uniref:Uncharacterized protein n=1 Tax=Paraphaeosphaeria minitans TaxID=565426 RepID=A0A9P6KQL1_9PLEO|nr:hypothetical protein PMIN01_06356 [Paraphaeosphaeria minitans]
MQAGGSLSIARDSSNDDVACWNKLGASQSEFGCAAIDKNCRSPKVGSHISECLSRPMSYVPTHMFCLCDRLSRCPAVSTAVLRLRAPPQRGKWSSVGGVAVLKLGQLVRESLCSAVRNHLPRLAHVPTRRCCTSLHRRRLYAWSLPAEPIDNDPRAPVLSGLGADARATID